jgi:DNA polymerase I-like protein with 3'-5' exonuclease and polymerase domains
VTVQSTDRDLSQVPVSQITSAAGLAELEAVFDATLVALDTETVYDPENPTDLETDGPGAWRVLSLAAKLADGSIRSFVVDMGHVPASAVQTLFARWTLHRLRRHVERGGQLTDSLGELLQLGELDAVDAVADATGQLRYDLDRVRSVVGAEAVVWNANFDRLVLARDGVDAMFLRDAMLYQAVLDLGRAGIRFYTGLAKAARAHLGVDLDGKGSTQLSYRDVADEPQLTAAQVRYAADDAVVTLRLFEVIAAKVAADGLVETVELEVGAQRFIDNLTRFGLPLDITGWREHLADAETAKVAVEATLATLTGAQTDLFGALDLGWSPSKDADIRRVLNEYATDRVRAYFSAKEGTARLLGREDSVDKTAMTQIGGELTAAILAWKKLEKVRSTYGEELVELADTAGRLHPRYLQAIVATGRLASNRPNAQNLSPEMKPFIRPPAGRVFVYADLGQAELRMLAQVSGDEVLRQAFRDGADIHVTTAQGMFKVDVAELIAAASMDDARLAEVAETLSGRGLLVLHSAADAPSETTVSVAGRSFERDTLVSQLAKYGSGLRSRGKTLNFGVCYGLRANSLATQLSVAGVPTDRDEANRLLTLYDEAYPGIAGWLKARDSFVEQLSANPPAVDFDATWELVTWHPQVDKVERRLRKQLGRRPDAVEISDELAGRSELAAQVAAGQGIDPADTAALDVAVAGELARRCALIDRVRSYATPVLLLADGTPWAFESRTPAGRRRLFNIYASAWVREMAMVAARSGKPRPLALRHRFEAERNVVLSDGKNPKRTVAFAQLKKRLSDTVARDYVAMVAAEMPEALPWLQAAGLSEAIKALGNQYRNAPIQGGVADAALWAYAEIQRQLDAFFPGAFGVQTVHDSITIECDRADANAISAMLRSVMEAGLARYTPDVPAVADLKVLSCLDEKVGALDAALLDPVPVLQVA